MKVYELIEELKGYNPNADVSLVSDETIFLSYIDDDGKYGKMSTGHVFIEGCDYISE